MFAPNYDISGLITILLTVYENAASGCVKGTGSMPKKMSFAIISN
jgi:hypothetical protein